MTLGRVPITPTPAHSPQGGGEQEGRRGACPGLSAPMPTGDGLLVRLLPVGTINLEALRALCEAARTHGNGVIEITARGSVQVRGLTAETAPRFANAIATLGIAAQDGVPVHCNALAGLDAGEIIDAAALAADLRRTLAETSLPGRLAPKISVAVDGGGMLGLHDLAADLRLCAVSTNGGPLLDIGVAGDAAGATRLGVVAPENGVAAALRLLDVIAQRGRTARAREVIAAGGAGAFRGAIAEMLLTPERDSCLHGNERKAAIGTHHLRDAFLAIGIGLPFGHTDARTLEDLTDAAASAGAAGVRAAAGRALMIIGVAPGKASDLLHAARKLGFIVTADDPRRYVFACSGAPACASAHIAARRIAAAIADIATPHLNDDFQIHISGCSKGCAHPAAAALNVVGGTGGCVLIANGTARDAPFASTAPDDLPAALIRYVGTRTREASRVCAQL